MAEHNLEVAFYQRYNYAATTTIPPNSVTQIEETRKWVREWNAEQREMVFWILEEEIRDDNLLLSTKKKLSLPKVKTSEIETGEDNG